MPIYEYRCNHCGHELEALQKISDAPLTDCPACKASELRRLISRPSFRLKGSGWYETDFKSDKETKRNIAPGKDESTSAKADEKPAKSDTSSTDAGKKSSDSKSDTKKDSGNAAA